MPDGIDKLLKWLIIGAFVGFMFYRRVRKTTGRQPLRVNMLVVRVVVLLLVGGLLLSSPTVTGLAIGYAAIGAVLGASLGLFGLRHTKFEFSPEGKFYTPHLYIGLAVIGLLVARMVYRFVVAGTAVAGDLGDNPPPMAFSSPLTLGVFAVLVGYYAAYSAGLVVTARRFDARAAASLPVGLSGE